MSEPKYVFNGNVGQVIQGDKIGNVSANITMGPNGEMTVNTTIAGVEDE